MQFARDFGRGLRSARFADHEFELVAREVAELEGTSRTSEHLDLRTVDVRQIRGVGSVDREQLRGDRVLVLRPGPVDPLARNTECIRESRGEVVRIPTRQRHTKDEMRIGVRRRVDGFGLEALEFAHAKVLVVLAQVAADAVGVADVVFHADGLLCGVCRAHS